MAVHPLKREVIRFFPFPVRQALSAVGSGVVCIAIAAIMAAAPAKAQTVTLSQARTVVIEELTMTKLKDMDFGYVLTNGAGGTVRMTTTRNNSCIPSARLGHSGICQYAEFAGYGESGRQVRIKLPGGNKLTLNGPGADIQLTDMVVDGTPEMRRTGQGKGFVKYRIDAASGAFAFRIGGTITINPGQLPGVYAAPFEVRIEYD